MASDLHSEILEREKHSWELLKNNPADLATILSHDCMMLFPGGLIFDAQSEPALLDILTRPDVKPWTDYDFLDVHVIPVGSDGAVISYSVDASREDASYEALISSVWRKEGGTWKMCLHQQTPSPASK